ncbi:TPA: hypothetical protein J5U08_003452, partial [Escherichia coli]|nr:hypothetical protein [Escherichia coli]
FPLNQHENSVCWFKMGLCWFTPKEIILIKQQSLQIEPTEPTEPTCFCLSIEFFSESNYEFGGASPKRQYAETATLRSGKEKARAGEARAFVNHVYAITQWWITVIVSRRFIISIYAMIFTNIAIYAMIRI